MKKILPRGNTDPMELSDYRGSPHMWRIQSQYCLSLQQLPRPYWISVTVARKPRKIMKQRRLIITWNAEGIHVLKPGWDLFFVGSHKCAYPTDMELISDRVDWLLFPPVFPIFPAPRRTPILPKPSRYFSASALNHSATVTHFRQIGETFIIESFRPPWLFQY